MIWKRVLIFSLLFLILVFGLFYYFLQNIPPPLRVDTVPPGAYVVPWMQPSSSFEDLHTDMLRYGTFDIDAVMANALKLSMTFNVTMWDGTTRVIPSTVYLGHDSQYLYIGGKFVGMYTNPASKPNDISPQMFEIYFDTADTGVLTYPESGSGFGVQISVPQDAIMSWQYWDLLWAYDQYMWHSMIWMPSGNYQPSQAMPLTEVGDACGYENSTGTVIMLYARLLRCPGNAEFNTLQMRPGERWVMGFLVQLWYQNLYNSTRHFAVDGWPKTTYGEWSNDSSWWPKLVIDLTNPPSTIP